MPHAIIADPPQLEDLHRGFMPWQERWADGTVLQLRGSYLRHDGTALLIECVSVELGPPVHFFTTVERKRDQLTVRCYPHPSPARTPAVKALVATVARRVLAVGGRIEKSNLEL